MNLLKKIFRKEETPVTSPQDFWKWFVQHEQTFYRVLKDQGNIERDFFDPLSPKLEQLREGIWFLAGMYTEALAELVLTPDGIIKHIAFIEDLIKAAPDLPNWRFTALKPELDIEDVNIGMGELEFNKDNLFFYPNTIPDCPDEIDITVVHTETKGAEEQDFINGTFIFLDNYLGEMNLATKVDHISIIDAANAVGELIPIAKLKDFINWRQKEFVEKYELTSYDTEHDAYATLEARLDDGRPVLAIVNQDLLAWEGKASHPWILLVNIQYPGNDSGMPEKSDYELMNELEDEMMNQLKDVEGYLNIGRETADNARAIYFACKEFRRPSRVMDDLVETYSDQLVVDYELYKDKYWQSLKRFTPSL